MIEDIARVMVSEDALKQKAKELGEQISRDYAGKSIFVVCILKGSFMFCADLMRCITVPVSIDFMCVSSYGAGSRSSGNIQILKDVGVDIRDKDVLIVEDIIDSGNTLKCLKEMLESRAASSVKICTMLNKPSRREVEIDADYIGFDIEDEFVVGYGLDYAEKYRNFPFVGVLKREVYEK